MAWKRQEGTTHKTDCRRVFNRLDLTCPRCQELAQGAEPRRGWNDGKREREAAYDAAIRAHDCKRAGCGPVCVAFDW